MAGVLLIVAAAALAFVAASPPALAQPPAQTQHLTPKFSKAVAFDISLLLEICRGLPDLWSSTPIK